MKYSEREIGIFELILEILKKWRFIVVSMLIFGVLYTCYCVNIKEAGLSAANVQKIYTKEDFSEMEWAEILYTNELQQTIIKQSEYLSNSKWIKMADVETNVISSYIQIEGENGKRNSLIWEDLLSSYVKGEDVLISIINDLGIEMEPVYLSELINVYIEVPENVIVDDTKNVILKVEVLNSDQEIGLKISEKTNELLKRYIEEEFNEVYVDVIEQNVSVMLLDGVATKKNQLLVSIQSNITYLTNRKAAMTSSQKQALEQMQMAAQMEDTESVTTPDTTVQNVSYSQLISVKDFIIGSGVGAVIGCIVVALYYMFNGKLRNEYYISECCDVNVLGKVIVSADKKSKCFGKLDALIGSGEWKEERKLTRDEQCKLIENSIFHISKAENKSKITIIGSSLDDVQKIFLNELGKSLEKSNIIINVVDASIGSTKMLNTVEAGDAIIIVEELHRSKQDAITKMLELCQNNQWPVLGAIVCLRG